MEDVEKSRTEHDVQHGSGHDIDNDMGHSVDYNIEHTLDHDIDQKINLADHNNIDGIVDQNVDGTIDPSLDYNLDHGLGHNFDHGVDHTVIHEVDDSITEDINNNVEEAREAGNLQPEEKQEHDEGAVDGGGENRWPGWPGESVFRMLVPVQKVGSIIGRKGEFIKKIVEETKARIKILDGPPGTSERAVMVSAREEPDSSLPPAIDGLLTVHKRITDGLDDDLSHAPPSAGGKVSTRLLVPASQAGSLIGKQGGTVKSIQETSNCVVRVLGTEDLPVFALQEDRVVEVVGDPNSAHKAVELIAAHLRKYLVDRSIIPLFEMHMQMANQPMEHMPGPHQSWGPPQGFPPGAGGGPSFGPNPQYMPPPRQFDNYYPPGDLHPMEKQSHQGISAYGREASIGVHASSNSHSAPSMITQVTQQMQIPLSYADAVIGTAGASISYIRRASGATVAIQETRGIPTEMTVEISGTATQVQTAQQLIQNFMAEAAAAAGAAVPGQVQRGGSTEHGYNPYAAAAHGSLYSSPPTNPGHAGGGYGSMYGGSYGY